MGLGTLATGREQRGRCHAASTTLLAIRSPIIAAMSRSIATGSALYLVARVAGDGADRPLAVDELEHRHRLIVDVEGALWGEQHVGVADLVEMQAHPTGQFRHAGASHVLHDPGYSAAMAVIAWPGSQAPGGITESCST